MKSNVIIAVLVVTILVATGCKKKQEPGCIEIKQGTMSLSPEEKAIHPYRKGDSIVFYNQQMDSLLSFTCLEQSSFYFTYSEHDPYNPAFTGCLGHYYETERYSTSFNPTDKRKRISFTEFGINPFESINKEKVLVIHLSVPEYSVHSFHGNYWFRKDTLLNNPCCPNANGYIKKFYPAMVIGNQEYSKVYLLMGAKEADSYEYIREILYSIKEGILSFSTNKNNVWQLQKKISCTVL